MDGLLGPEKAAARLAELQQRIDTFAAKPAPATAFASTLSGMIPGNSSLAPVDPKQLGFSNTSSFAPLADAAAAKYNLDPKIFKALVTTESSWNPQATSGVGAIGLCQLMPTTATALGVANPHDPAQNIEGGAKYLRQMLDQFGGDYTKALAAYNAGPGAVVKANGVPPFQETIAYVRKIKQLAEMTR